VPVRDEHGTVTCWAGINLDISRLKQAERELFDANQRWQALMRAVPVGVSFSDDPTCQRITGNPAALAQFEVDAADNLSASAPDSVAPGRQLRFFREGRPVTDSELPLQRAVAENIVIPPMELEVHLPSGRRWFAEASGAPVRGPHGEVVGGLAVTADITQRKRAEEALRESEARLRLAQRHGGVGVWSWDVQTGALNFEPETEGLYGLVPGTIRTYADWTSRVHSDDLARIEAERDATLARGEAFQVEFRIQHSSGEERWIAAKGRADYDQAGQMLRVLGVNIDITDGKRAETEIRRHAEELRSANEELNRFNEAMVGRELRMVELKQEVNALCAQLGQPPRYGTEVNEQARPTP
jgi:PAS domain S-box-containing protein